MPSSKCLMAALLLAASVGSIGAQDSSSPAETVDEPDNFHIGVVRAWRSPQRDASAVQGDRIVVETKNLDGWVIRRLNELRGVPTELRKPGTPVSPDLARILEEHYFEETIRVSGWVDLSESRVRSLRQGKTEFETKPIPKSVREYWKQFERILKSASPANESEDQLVARAKAVLIEAHALMLEAFQLAARTLSLKIDDTELPGSRPLVSNAKAVSWRLRTPKTDEDSYHWFSFDLTQTAASVDFWSRLRRKQLGPAPVFLTLTHELNGRRVELDTAIRPLQVDKGLEGYHSFRIGGVEHHWVWAAGLLVAVIVAVLGWFGTKSDLLRDHQREPRPDLSPPYSLARCQIAFWFALVAASYVYLVLLTGTLNVFNDTALWLIGIGAGTALGASLLQPDPGKASEVKVKAIEAKSMLGVWEDAAALTAKALAEAEKVQINYEQAAALAAAKVIDAQRQLTPHSTLPANSPEMVAKAAADEELEKARRDTAAATEANRIAHSRLPQKFQIAQFWRDLLTEDGHYNIQKFQMAAWTLIFGLFFVQRVLSEGAFPKFDPLILGLLGISAGAYLGFKLPNTSK